jgi:hypothetical protein
LSQDASTWTSALNGTFTNTDCNTGNAVQGPSGSSFLLYCSTGTAGNANLQIYQVAVKAISLGPTKTPLRAVKAYLSQRTLGTDIATGMHAAAAMELTRQPPPANEPVGYWLNWINVQWGPIVCLETNNNDPWLLRAPIDAGRFPRKFASGSITGTVYQRAVTWRATGNTDNQEYWAYATQDIPPTINESAYQMLASSSNIPVAPRNAMAQGGQPIPRVGCGTAQSNCGVFQPNPGDTAIFDGNGLAGNAYTVPANSYVYVLGNAAFNNVSIENATFIITGDLTISTSAVVGFHTNLHVPVTAPFEYPYLSTGTWPCQNMAGDTLNGQPQYDCPSDTVFSFFGVPFPVQYWGFLDVKGTMSISNGLLWDMVGSLLVGDLQAPAGSGGHLQVFTGAAFQLAYDDIINHSILVNPISGTQIKLVPDSIQDVAP